MRILFLFILLVCLGINSFGQKMTGIGVELSALSLKPNVRMWLSRTSGFEVFGGVSSELNGFKPNDYEGGIKYLHTFLYNRTNRTYYGLVGKLKWMVFDEVEIPMSGSVPVAGVFIGKEWFTKRAHLKGFAIELGYQYGFKNYEIQINPSVKENKTYEEFPLIFNLRYSYYKKR